MKWQVCILFFLLVFSVKAQKRSAQKLFAEAELQIDQNKALVFYQKALAKDSSYTQAYIALARIYEVKQDYTLQVKTLQRGSEKVLHNKEFLLAQLAKAAYLNGQYKLAYNALDQLPEIKDSQLLHLLACINFSIDGQANPLDFEARNLGMNVNTVYHDYWPSLSIDEQQIVTTVFVDDENDLDAPSQEDLFISEKNSNGWQVSKALSPIINSPENEGAQSLSADGNTMLFTACNRSDGFGACDIYITRKMDEGWSAPLPFPYPVNTDFWEGHPSLSADGHYLFFSSDRTGGFGGRDIYQAEIDLGADVTIKRIRNLGEMINTEKHEISPFIHADGKTLYFSSDGHIGFGRQDIFKSQMDSTGQFSEISNLGFPVNTHHDEIGLVVNPGGSKAYFATEREDSRKKDIYVFDLPSAYRPQEVTYFKAKVRDKETLKPLKVMVELSNTLDGELVFAQNIAGEFIIPLPVGQDYAINVSHPEYLFYSDYFPLQVKMDKSFEKEILLSPIRKGEVLVLKNVLFEHNSAQLDTSFTVELDRAVALIQNNDELQFEISGHTDSSGSDDYNLKLSEERAKVVYEYFVSQGIEADRLSYKGYGSTRPVSNKDDENRRTELLVK